MECDRAREIDREARPWRGAPKADEPHSRDANTQNYENRTYTQIRDDPAALSWRARARVWPPVCTTVLMFGAYAPHQHNRITQSRGLCTASHAARWCSRSYKYMHNPMINGMHATIHTIQLLYYTAFRPIPHISACHSLGAAYIFFLYNLCIQAKEQQSSSAPCHAGHNNNKAHTMLHCDTASYRLPSY